MSDTPDSEGYYWAHFDLDSEPSIIRVMKDEFGILVYSILETTQHFYPVSVAKAKFCKIKEEDED